MYTNRKKVKMQGKDKAHTKQVIKSQVTELIRAKRIKTTPSKAKIVKSAFDRLVTHAKKGNEVYVKSFFANNEKAVARLNAIIKEHLSDRTSGYTRIVKTLPRKGDGAEQAFIMLVNTEVSTGKSALSKALQKQNK